MAALAPAREPLNIRTERFRDMDPDPDSPVGVIIAHFYHLWHEADGGGVTNYSSAERLASYLPPGWDDWALLLLEEMAIGDDEFGPVLLNIPDFVHVLLTRWIYPPDPRHPFAVEAEALNVVFPDPPDDPAAQAVQPARAPSPPSSPPHTPPPVLPPNALNRIRT